MATFICASCNDEVTPNPKLKGRQQSYCGKANCQKARKAAWKRKKMRSCPEFRSDHALSNKKWSMSHPSYWQDYRLSNPDKTYRNRLLQHQRNRRLRSPPEPPDCKGRRDNTELNQMVGEYWLVPVIAKVDAIKVNIAAIRGS